MHRYISFLEIVPFCVSTAAIRIHWDQFLALIGALTSRQVLTFG